MGRAVNEQERKGRKDRQEGEMQAEKGETKPKSNRMYHMVRR